MDMIGYTKSFLVKELFMKVKEITFTALMAAVCCILGPLSIPIGAIPISLSVLSVYLCVFALGTKFGTVSVLIYLLLGAVGLPVFSGFQGGIAKLAGPTGGYIIGFVFQAFVTGIFLDIASRSEGIRKYVIQIIGMVIGLAVCYTFGTIWFMVSTSTPLAASLSTCVIPFLPFDALKIAIGAIVGNALRIALSKANLVIFRKAANR